MWCEPANRWKGWLGGGPVVAVDDLVERAALGRLDGGQRPVGGVAERDEEGPVPVRGEAEQLWDQHEPDKSEDKWKQIQANCRKVPGCMEIISQYSNAT